MLMDPKALWDELKEAGYDPVRSATHESGHALIALRSCYDIKQITILPNLHTGSFGSIAVNTMIDVYRRLLWMVDPPPFDATHYLKRYIAYVLGGAAAEYLQYGRISDGCDQDLEEAKFLVAECFPDSPKEDGLLPYFEEASNLLSLPDIWGKVGVLRDALLAQPAGMDMMEIAAVLGRCDRCISPPGPGLAEKTGEKAYIFTFLRDYLIFS
jgi:hypothetical protein